MPHGPNRQVGRPTGPAGIGVAVPPTCAGGAALEYCCTTWLDRAWFPLGGCFGAPKKRLCPGAGTLAVGRQPPDFCGATWWSCMVPRPQASCLGLLVVLIGPAECGVCGSDCCWDQGTTLVVGMNWGCWPGPIYFWRACWLCLEAAGADDWLLVALGVCDAVTQFLFPAHLAVFVMRIP
ncbi:hypothetical protein NDU88_003955 [Pleurodeles waltl]|uniref:Uncharacterized protein n=1 Tax=Pleurodeles waltl TaxID=8319 RepID=A0AAV7QDF5_PLEWA|nr:hypothetical protein NDU88_003955 [Pleurodeles waltl]